MFLTQNPQVTDRKTSQTIDPSARIMQTQNHEYLTNACSKSHNSFTTTLTAMPATQRMQKPKECTHGTVRSRRANTLQLSQLPMSKNEHRIHKKAQETQE
jgi:hypothetical protein